MNPVVVAWVVVSLLGALVSLYLVHESRLDVDAFENRANGRRRIARSRFIREAMRVTVHEAYIVAGLTVLGVLPLSTAIVVPILMWGNVVMLANSVIDARTRALLFATRTDEATIPDR